MNWFVMTLHHALVMLWETFWALVMGFGVSAGLQTFVSKEQMSRAFGRTNLKTMLLATGFGAASSSCSYAAAAAGRSAIQQGAALIPALAFMFASTNLVIELGAVYTSMVLAGIIVDLVFAALGLIPEGPRPPSVVEHIEIIWNYTSWLDIVAAIVFAFLITIQMRKPLMHDERMEVSRP